MFTHFALPILLVLFTLVAPPKTAAQDAEKTYRIGVLHPGFSKHNSTQAFVERLRDLGYM